MSYRCVVSLPWEQSPCGWQTSQMPGKDRKLPVDKASTCPLLRGRLQESQQINDESRSMQLGLSSGQHCFAGQNASVIKNHHVLISVCSFKEESVHHEIRINFFSPFLLEQNTNIPRVILYHIFIPVFPTFLIVS